MNSWVTASLGIIFGLMSLLVGGESLVRGASRLASTLNISPLIIGLTVVAFGTSSPEFAVSIQSSLSGKSDIALGNVVGSNIFNVLFILGISALITPLVVSSRLIRWDVPLMILASVLLLLMGYDGRIDRADGSILFTALICYTYWCVRQSRKEQNDAVATEFAREIPVVKPSGQLVVWQIVLVTFGLGLLGLGSQLLVGGSVFVAKQLGVSELVIGLTIVSAGTSLPEVVTSIMAAIRGEREIAVGNVVGSNIFNILGVLGLASALSPVGIAVSPSVFRFDIPVMLAASFACLPIFLTGNLMARWEGGVFFAYYLAYTAYLILAASEATITRTFGTIMVAFVIPLTALTVLTSLVRSVRVTSKQ